MSDTSAKIDRLKALLDEACSVGDEDLAHEIVEQLIDLRARTDTQEPAIREEKVPVWNEDPEWMAYCATELEPLVRKIANKYTTDEALREDCENEARLSIYQIFPDQVDAYPRFKAGELSLEKWQKALKKYCSNAIRNSVLSYLDSPNKGPWYIGRTKRVRDKTKKSNKRIKEHAGPRYSSLEHLMEEAGLQINEEGDISWDVTSNDGIAELQNNSPHRKSHSLSRPLNFYSEE